MKFVSLPEALDRAEAWIGRSYALSPATFAAADSLHRICDIEGIEVRAMASDASVALGVFRRGDFSEDTWLFSQTLHERHGSLAVRASTELPHGRAFLASILCEAYTPLDADRMLQWWRSLSDDRRCTVSITLPSASTEVCDLLAQLEQATRDAAIADLSGWGAR